MRIASGLALGAALLAATACGPATAPASGAATRITASLSDSAITLDQSSAPAGKVTFAVTNAGSVVHSLLVIKTNLDQSKIPASPQDASRVDERGSVGSLGQLQPGQSKEFTLDLAAGKYVIVCNEPAHYLVGMHTAFTVK